MELDTDKKRKEWFYPMRREMQLIVPGVYLGPFSAATKTKCQSLCDHGITHIVCIRHEMEARYIQPKFPQQIKYLVLDIADHPCANILQHIPKVNDFIKECLCINGRVLVHGNSGISRSAAFVIAFVMKHYSVSFTEAYDYVRCQRFCIMPNIGFIQQLKEYEPIYKAQCISSDDSEWNKSTQCGIKRDVTAAGFEPHIKNHNQDT